MGFQIENGVLKKYIKERGVTEVVIPDGVTSIGDYAFARCSSLTSIVILTGVTSIGEKAFFDCSSLISLRIPAHLGKELNQILPKTKHLIRDSRRQYYRYQH